MSAEENNLNSTKIMEYLIRKLEARYNTVSKFTKIFNTLDSYETLYSLRQELKLLFNDLEEDFRQGIFAIKALTAQNKKILDDLNVKENENKNITEQLNNILVDNKNLKMQLIKIKDKKINPSSKKDLEMKKREENFNLNFNENRYDNDNINKDKVDDNGNENKGGNYEYGQLSNVKNIMDNMKKNKMKLKMAIEQHFNNNQEE